MTDDNNIQKIVHDLACELIIVVNKEHSMLLSEISRMKNIVNEASRSLHQSFNAMDSHNRKLRNELEKLARDSIKSSGSMEESTQENKSPDLNIGIRALQFEDIIQQMLDHARHRIHTIEKLFSVLEDKISSFDNGSGELEKVKKTLHECHIEIQKTRKLLELENPVKLDSLGKSDVTLF